MLPFRKIAIFSYRNVVQACGYAAMRYALLVDLGLTAKGVAAYDILE